MRTLALSIALLGVAAAAPAQGADPDKAAAGGGQLAAGWQARLDKPTAKMADLKLEVMGTGLHATSGPSAIYWNPAHTAKGSFTAQASFTQTKSPQHPEAYGLLVGGKDLAGPSQDYLYYLVRKDGKYFIAHRAGAERHVLAEWTAHPAIKAEDASGKATNTLAVESTPTEVRFLANGQQVAAFPRGENKMIDTDGLVGVRVNHNLDVHIEGLSVKQK